MTDLGPVQRVTAAAARLFQCGRLDPRLSLRMFGLRLTVPLLKRCLPIGVLANLMWKAPGPSAHEDTAAQVARIRALALVGGRVLVSRNCLTRSLVLYRLLSHAGADPQLLLGTRRSGRDTAGHAWVELNGQVFPKPDEELYAAVVRFNARAARPHSTGLRGRPA